MRIVGRDALPCDDVRYFTVDVRPPSKVLLLGRKRRRRAVSARGAGADARPALAQSKFACEVAHVRELGELHAGGFRGVCLVDPPPLPAAAWQSLVDYADAAAALGISLGRNARRDEMNAAEPQQLLPAKLRWQSREATYLRPVAVEHPALARAARAGRAVPWSEFPVFKYWELEAGDEPAHVVATFANGKPALVERQIGAGRVLMMTTSRFRSGARRSLEFAADGARSVAVPRAGEWHRRIPGRRGRRAAQLSGRADGRVAAVAGGAGIELRAAAARWQRGAAIADAGPDRICRSRRPRRSATIACGPADEQERLDRGFSVNLPAEMSRLERVDGASSSRRWATSGRAWRARAMRSKSASAWARRARVVSGADPGRGARAGGRAVVGESVLWRSRRRLRRVSKSEWRSMQAARMTQSRTSHRSVDCAVRSSRLRVC